MSSGSGDLPSSFDRFREVWGWDVEWHPNANRRGDPVTLFAEEMRNARTVRMTRRDLLLAARLPFGYGADVLVESYSAVAELGLCVDLRLPAPTNVMCTYAEAAAAVNGLDIDGLTEKRPSLLEACDLYRIPHMDKAHKDEMRDLIVGKHPDEYTDEEWRQIEEYNADDVLADIALFAALAPAIDVPAALFRGRYSKAVAAWEARGIPVDVEYVRVLQDNWHDLRMHYIRRDDHLHLYDDEGHFHEDRFRELIDAREWVWPRTCTGKPEMRAKVLGKMARRYPELRPLQRLRDQIAELRLGAFLNTIGADGASRCPTLPFWTRTGRNQPSGRNLAYLLSLPSWIHGLIKPREGWGIAVLDWTAQEIGAGAGLSHDQAMIEDYRAGDFHIALAIRSGIAPVGATKETHGPLRDSIKPVSLGMGYGITKYGIAAQTGKSLLWSAETLAAYRHAYPTFIQWQHDTATQALFDERIVSPLGWPMAVHANTRRRTLMNYMQQSAGADTMRLGAIAGHEAGVQIIGVAHDAFWITAPLSELDAAVATMSRLMVRAGAEVTGLEIPVEVAAIVCWPKCLGDVRRPTAKGQAMWDEIKGLLNGGLRQARAG
jgi:hypothetical protein